MPDVDQAALDRAPDDRQADHRSEHLREERDDVDVQDSHVAFFDRLRRLVPAGAADPFVRGTRALERGRLEPPRPPSPRRSGWRRPRRQVAAVRNKLAIVAVRRGDRDARGRAARPRAGGGPALAAAITTWATCCSTTATSTKRSCTTSTRS